MPPRRSEPLWLQRSFSARLILTAVTLAFWFWTQSLIGARPSPASGIGDAIHNATASLNLYLQNHAAVTNTLLIVSSTIIDFLAVFILSLWIFRGDAQPFLGLVIVLALRQLMQACIALPAPPGTIWRYPGFPSLVVTYGVANDYFFSSHTAIAVIGAITLASFKKRWLTVVAAGLVLFEVATVLALRAHYTMDVFTGLVTALYAAHLSERIVNRARSHWLWPRKLKSAP